MVSGGNKPNMFPFWKDVIAPIIEASGATRIVEIGALRGENTELMLRRLGPDVEFHVIDPLPEFDPNEHQHRFPGQYVFHQDLSVNVLGDLEPMDVALIDGDHNWYTVFTELTMLADVARKAATPLPVLILHDVGWPYGRRDLYYDPSNIPDEHRQPWRQAGMRPGEPGLLPGNGGVNAGLANAEVEGGPRNGVMTGLDDFIAGYDRPLRLVVLPTYFGLAIVVDEERLSLHPELAAELDRLESPEGKDMLLRLAEEIRLQAVFFDQIVLRQRDETIDRLTGRHLETIKREIVNDLHIQLEVQIHYLLDTVDRGGQVDTAVLQDPARHLPDTSARVQQQHNSGEPLTLQAAKPPEGRLPDEGMTRQGYALSGRAGLDHLHECLDTAWATVGPGDIAVCGAGLGGPSVFLAAYLDTHDHEIRPALRRKLWVADRFHPTDDHVDLNRLRDILSRFDLLDDRARFLQGDLGATLADIGTTQLVLLHLGRGIGPDAPAALEHLYPRLARGGAVVVEDIDEAGVRAAIESFRTERGISTPTDRVGRAGIHWIKEEPLGEPTASESPVQPAVGAGHSPLAPRLRTQPRELSVIVVVHNMRREAARSLYALSRRYQLGIGDLRYEVLVVENGSSPDNKAGADLVRDLGREFRYIDLTEKATPSPARALNRGIAEARGRNFALMVDGAHIVTPRVLHYGLAGLSTYAPAIVAVQPWYVGPGQQGDVMRSGYDQAAEDALFEQISWPSDGYRLFEIGHFVSDRDWFDGLWESNCLFVGRDLLEQVGGFDEGFAMAGGGYTNLDLYERLASSPDLRVVTIIGEGSFHQLHGGTTTNLPDQLQRRSRIRSYTDHFADLRGRPFMGPEKPIHYVGGFHADAARRSRARRMTATVFDVEPDIEGIDGPATGNRIVVPDDLKASFTNAYFRSGAWDDTSWLGRPVHNAATDLVTYQEILTEVRPDWIIETGTGDGGRAYFLATICDMLDHGHIVSVAPGRASGLPEHPRISYVTGEAAHKPAMVEQVREIVGSEPHALVILGTRTKRDRTRREFEAYSPLVPVGSYVIIEHTALNGFPIDASFGEGPHEATRRIMNLHGEFLADTEREKHALTFNAGGFLRRIS